MGKRLAILKVTRQQLRREIKPENYLLIEHDLGLPSDVVITGISEHLLFDEDLVAVRIECPDFREVAEGEKIPFIGAIYIDGKFRQWHHAGGIMFTWQSEALVNQHDSMIRLPGGADMGAFSSMAISCTGRCSIKQELLDGEIFGLMSADGRLEFQSGEMLKAAEKLGSHPTVMCRVTRHNETVVDLWAVFPLARVYANYGGLKAIDWRSQGAFTIHETREQALAEFERLGTLGDLTKLGSKTIYPEGTEVKLLSIVDGGDWSPTLPMKPGDTFTMNGEPHVVVKAGSSNLGEPDAEGTRICICPAANMLADGWKCDCGAAK